MFETTINNSAKSINKLNANVNTIFYGVNSGTKSIQDIGLFGLLNTLSSIDLCNVINYELNKLSNPNNNSNFDPTKKPDPVSSITSPLNNTIWNIKYAAFSLQQTIDGFNSRNQSSINKNDLTNTAQDVIIQLQSITNANSPESTQNPTIISIFPGIILINNFIENSIGFLSQNPDLRTVPDPVIQKTIQYFDNIRQICLNIQALNSLAALSNSFLNKQLQDDLNSLSKLIDPKKIISVLSSILQSTKSIEQFSLLIISIISTLQVFTKICILLVKIFSAIVKFLFVLPIPNMFTTEGSTTLLASSQNNISKAIEEITRDLKAINNLFDSIAYIATDISIKTQEVVQKLTLINLNLQNCNNIPSDILNGLNDTINNLSNTKTSLDNFVNSSTSKKSDNSMSYGNYTISIITEKLTDTSIVLPRRYGIALDQNNEIIVQSTPTFASDNNVIIEEVQLLLSAKGLVSPNSIINSNQLSTIQNSINYLQDSNITDNLDFPASTYLDNPNNEDENSGLGLNAFINKQSGGKKLRSRMQNALSKANSQLNSNLNSIDPNSNIGASITEKLKNI